MIAVTLLVATLSPGIGAEPLEEHERFAADVEHWRQTMELFDVPGAAIGVIEGDAAWTVTLGRRDAAGRPVTQNSVFYIASITKTYVATLLAILAERGALSLDDPVQRHLPRLDLADDRLEASITVRDLLAHRPGIRSGEIVLLDAYTGEITEDRYFDWLREASATGQTTYTNVHFTLAGRVVEAVAGRDWRDVLDEHLFGPGGLERTTGYASEMYGRDDAAIPLEIEGGAWRPTAQRKTDRTMHAAGGLGTSLQDALRYLRLHLDRGRVGSERLFSDATSRDILREHSTHEPDGTLRIMTGFGLGWARGTFNGEPMFAHGGGYVGTTAWFAMLPERNAAIAILVNGGGFARGWHAAVAIDLLEGLTGTTAEWDPWERFSAQAREHKAEAARPASADVEAARAELTRPAGLYTGMFRNPRLGTFRVTRDDDALVLHLGDRPVTYEPGGPDTLRLPGLADPPATLEFLVGPRGRIDRLRFTDEGRILLFER